MALPICSVAGSKGVLFWVLSFSQQHFFLFKPGVYIYTPFIPPFMLCAILLPSSRCHNCLWQQMKPHRHSKKMPQVPRVTKVEWLAGLPSPTLGGGEEPSGFNLQVGRALGSSSSQHQ